MSQQHNQSIPGHDDQPLQVDPGHVRQRQHYEAMLRELHSQQNNPDQS